MKTHLIMPMCGAGSRFKNNGYPLPKPIIEISGKPFFYWATRSVEKFVDLEDITYVILRQHIQKYSIDKLIKKYYPLAKVVILPEVTKGPLFTCLKGLLNIDDDCPVLFNDCDHMFKCNLLNNFLNEDNQKLIDGALLTFESAVPHFSFVKYDAMKNIIGTVEKEVVSNRAICGAYYFKSAALFRQIADVYMDECPYKETFLSGMYNIMCERDMLVKDFLVDFHVEFGTPEEYVLAEKSNLFDELL